MIEEIVAQEISRKRPINRIKIHRLFILLGLVLVLYSCDKKRVYEDFYTSGSNGWDKDSVANFEVNIPYSTMSYNILINCRNLENYPYSNLWLFVDVINPDSMAIRDTVEYQLALPNGKWTGNGTGGVYENQFMYRSNVFFPKAGIYKFQIQHGMRDEKLKGMKDIGIRIEKK